jgi:two-component system, OmpR family, KDP operon response regulator KdpE
MTGALEPLILVVEDELPMRRFLRTALAAQGYRVLEAESVGEAVIAATTQNPELILLDLGLPDGDGLDLARRLREWSSIPIIVLSARGREADKVEALDAGADDYLTKPFSVGELLARLRVALRHARQVAASEPGPVLVVGGLSADLAARRVTLDGHQLHLTPIEYRLLVYLLHNVDRVLTHRQILKEVWGPPYLGQTHYVRVYMAELRKKIEADPARPKYLLTEPGVGYRLREGP